MPIYIICFEEYFHYFEQCLYTLHSANLILKSEFDSKRKLVAPSDAYSADDVYEGSAV